MKKKYIIRLSDKERTILRSVITNGEDTPFRIRRAQILLHADEDGHNWTHIKISEVFGCGAVTVANICKSFLDNGLMIALKGKQPGWNLLDSNQESKIISLYRGAPPDGYENWSLRLLTKKTVELGIVDSICHETIRKTLRKYNNV